jgi:hypothetical protein
MMSGFSPRHHMPNLEERPWLRHHFEEPKKRDLPTITPMPLIPLPQSDNYGTVPPKIFPAVNYGTVPPTPLPAMNYGTVPTAPFSVPNYGAIPEPGRGLSNYGAVPTAPLLAMNYGAVPQRLFPAVNYGNVSPKSEGVLRNTNWEPGGGGASSSINNVIYLDGQAIARAVHDYQSADMTHARQASSFNGRESYYGPDWSPIIT